MMIVDDWGVIEYAAAWQRQTELFDSAVEAKRASVDTIDRLVLCEHPKVITLGRSAKVDNLLFNEEELAKRGFSLFRIDRGGDVTYHGPGQLVVYPIFDLEHYHIGLKEYVWRLEEAVIRLLSSYGIEATRLDGATGVWIEPRSDRARKICAIGVRCSRYITMHGLALNVTTQLSDFSVINPCGFVDKGVTSMRKELNAEVEMAEVKARLTKLLGELFRM